MTAELLNDLLTAHVESGAAGTAATFRVAEPGGYGRVLRSDAGIRIVEAKDATAAELARSVEILRETLRAAA